MNKELDPRGRYDAVMAAEVISGRSHPLERPPARDLAQKIDTLN
jgi:hypothetical protein